MKNHYLIPKTKWSGVLSNPGQIEGLCEKVTERMVEESLGRMKIGKTTPRTGVTADFLKVRGKDCIKRLMDVVNGL